MGCKLKKAKNINFHFKDMHSFLKTTEPLKKAINMFPFFMSVTITLTQGRRTIFQRGEPNEDKKGSK